MKKKRLFDIKDTTDLGDATRCCPSHHLPHSIPLIQKPITDEPCHTHRSICHRLHHNFFCNFLKCPNYNFMMEKTKKILNEPAIKRVLVFGGPTGAGETTITKEIIKRYPNFRKLVAATTRNMRTGEQEKVDYHFMSKEEFQDEIKKGNIIEHTYIENRDTYYGSYKPDLDKKIDAGLNVIVNVDIVGAKYFKENYNATTIFIKPESLDELKGRFTKRDPNISSKEIEKRIQNAKEEMEKEMSFYDHVVTNSDGKLESAIEDIIDILKKENYSLA